MSAFRYVEIFERYCLGFIVLVLEVLTRRAVRRYKFFIAATVEGSIIAVLPLAEVSAICADMRAHSLLISLAITPIMMAAVMIARAVMINPSLLGCNNP